MKLDAIEVIGFLAYSMSCRAFHFLPLSNHLEIRIPKASFGMVMDPGAIQVWMFSVNYFSRCVASRGNATSGFAGSVAFAASHCRAFIVPDACRGVLVRGDQPSDGGLTPLLHPSLKRAELPVGEAALPVALEAAQDFYRGPVGLGLEPFLNPWPNGRKGVFACAPKANEYDIQCQDRGTAPTGRQAIGPGSAHLSTTRSRENRPHPRSIHFYVLSFAFVRTDEQFALLRVSRLDRSQRQSYRQKPRPLDLCVDKIYIPLVD